MSLSAHRRDNQTKVRTPDKLGTVVAAAVAVVVALAVGLVEFDLGKFDFSLVNAQSTL
jgi:predicted outer membrane lipoprotein